MSQDPTPPCWLTTSDGVSILSLTGTSIKNDTRDALYEFCERMPQIPEPRWVVLDLSTVKSLDSTAIGILVNFQKKVRDNRGHLKLCGLESFVLELFRLTKMDQVLDIRGTRDEAIAAFQGRSRGKSSKGDSGSGGWFSKVFGGK